MEGIDLLSRCLSGEAGVVFFYLLFVFVFFFFSSRRRHTRWNCDWSSDVCSSDLFGHAPETVAETIRFAAAAGLAGGSIEDASGDPAAPIYEFEHAVERVTAAAAEARRHGFVLTARAENFVHDRPDLDDTVRRLQAYERAGADVLFAPGLPDLAAVDRKGTRLNSSH